MFFTGRILDALVFCRIASRESFSLMTRGNLRAKFDMPRLTLLLPLVLGCSNADFGDVRGTVTLDGAPLAAATVQFQPETGSPSYAVTEDDGSYRLMYSATQAGAEIGEHLVRVETARRVDDPETGRATFLEEKLPPRYHAESELTREVTPGRNVIDLELTSE